MTHEELRREILGDIARIEKQGAGLQEALRARIAELERPLPWWERLFWRVWP